MKLMLFLTGNADNGSFGVAGATVMDRCGMTEGTYKNARKSLIDRGWIIHKPSKNGQQGEIIVDYDAIYKSAADIDNTPSSDIENTPSESEDTPTGYIDNTHNNISNSINNNKNTNTIKSKIPTITDRFTDKNGNFKF